MNTLPRRTAQIARSVVVFGWAALGIAACSGEPATSSGSGGRAGSIEGGASAGAPARTGGAGGALSGVAGALSGAGGATSKAGGSAASSGGAANASAGRGDSSATDGGADNAGGPAQSSCAGRDLLLCEDFEDTAVGAVPSGWTRHGELAAVDGADAHSGSRALRLGPSANGERRIHHDAKLLGSAHWGRIYFKVQTPVPDPFVHSTLVSLIGDGPKNGRSDYRPIDTVKQAKDTPNVGGRHNFIYNVQIIGKGEFGTETSYDYLFDAKWHCAEYRIQASNQSYTLYFDGKDVLHFNRGAGNYDASDIPNVFDELRVGWINYQSAAPGFTAWIDDIAFDDARIGCD